MGYRIKCPGKRTAILTHYPTITDNMGDLRTLSFFGHTHQENNFYPNYPNMYHVGMDSHNCTPVLLEDALEEMKKNKGVI
jgi:calcineurin-like phosphoesterase family protein